MNKFIYIFIFIFSVFNATGSVVPWSQQMRSEAMQKFKIAREKIINKERVTRAEIDDLKNRIACLNIPNGSTDPEGLYLYSIIAFDNLKKNIITNFNAGRIGSDEEVAKVLFALVNKDKPDDVKNAGDRFIKLLLDYDNLHGILNNFVDRASNNTDRERLMYYLREAAKDLNNACLEQLGGQLSTNDAPFRDAVKVYSSERARNNRKALASTLAFIISNPTRYRSIFPALFEVGSQLSRDPLAVSLLCGNAENFSNYVNLKTFFSDHITMRGFEIWYELLFAIPQSEIDNNSGTSLGYKFIKFLEDVNNNFSVNVAINTQTHYSFTTNMFEKNHFLAPHLCKVGAWTVYSGMGIILSLAGEREISIRRLVVGGIAQNGVQVGNINEEIFLGLPYGDADHTYVAIVNNTYAAVATANRLSNPLNIEGAYSQAFRDPTIDNGNFGKIGVGGTNLSGGNLDLCNLFVLTFGFKPGIQYNQDIQESLGKHGGVFCDTTTIAGGLTAANMEAFLTRFKPVIRPNFRLAFSAGNFAAGADAFHMATNQYLQMAAISNRVRKLWYCINIRTGNDKDVMGRGYFYGALMPTQVGGAAAVVAPNDSHAAALVNADRPITKSYYIEDMEANYDKELVEEFERVR